MALTDKQIYDLNHMNVAAQNVQLGTIINALIDGGVSSLNWDDLDEDTKRILMAISNSEEGVDL